jgi:hypothetical protein
MTADGKPMANVLGQPIRYRADVVVFVTELPPGEENMSGHDIMRNGKASVENGY